ncbi:hypothetical protein U9M48_025236 [Paspalum notatum var. saurae]|uniref:RING-type E3 ubiquitin transferase n=1 Tax=Paspalum notatum var. saurae TaxID=547442 RepID=A0AAQ3TQ00_PASNO
MASSDAADSPRSARSRPGAAAAKDGAAGLLSPRFRSAAALAGWDEESLLFASLVVEDTPVRESRRKRRPSASASSSAGGSAGSRSGTRKRRLRRQSPVKIPSVVLALDDDDDKTETVADGKSEMKDAKEDVEVVDVGEEASGSDEKAVATGNLACMDRLREELSCAICLDICFEPSTTPCGHSFCMKCLKHAAAKCGKRCPKCRQLISNSRMCTINTVLWNTIQLLFPAEVEARRNSISSPSSSNKDVNCSPQRSNSFSQGGGGGMRTRSSSSSFITEGRTRSSYRTTSSNTNGSFISAHGTTRGSNRRRGFVPASQLVNTRSTVRSDQSEDAVLAYRLQQEEFMNAFEEPEQERQPQNTVSTARDNLRAMASRAIRLRARGWPV